MFGNPWSCYSRMQVARSIVLCVGAEAATFLAFTPTGRILRARLKKKVEVSCSTYGLAFLPKPQDCPAAEWDGESCILRSCDTAAVDSSSLVGFPLLKLSFFLGLP